MSWSFEKNKNKNVTKIVTNVPSWGSMWTPNLHVHVHYVEQSALQSKPRILLADNVKQFENMKQFK
jgi:hypothetical protein